MQRLQEGTTPEHRTWSAGDQSAQGRRMGRVGAARSQEEQIKSD